jgi:hypothetical protein
MRTPAIVIAVIILGIFAAAVLGDAWWFMIGVIAALLFLLTPANQ